jgi:heat shock protein HslJ
MFHRQMLVIAVLVLALVSCATGPTTPSEIAIPGITWKLRSIQRAGSVTIDIPVPERFTVLFRDDQRAVVRADCNTCTGRYELSGSNLQLGSLACTRAFCGADSPDASFLHALAVAASAARNGRTLTLSGAGTVLILEQ